MILMLLVAAYAAGLGIVFAFCLMAKLSGEFRFSDGPTRFQRKQPDLTVSVRPIPFDTPPHNRHSRKVA